MENLRHQKVILKLTDLYSSTLFFFFSQVLDVISALKDLKREEAAQVMYDNTLRMFFPKV